METLFEKSQNFLREFVAIDVFRTLLNIYGVIHKVRTLRVGRSGPAKSVLALTWEGEVQLQVCVRHNFFSQAR